METQTTMNWGAFDSTGGNDDFLKMKDGESCVVTFEKVEIVNVPAEDANGNPITLPDGKPKMKPQLKLSINSVTGIKAAKIWNTGNRQIVAQVRSLVEAGVFDKWIYQISKHAPSGNSTFSSYSLIQLTPKA
jgi:hypothetical protein